jgi:hypothetical protein
MLSVFWTLTNHFFTSWDELTALHILISFHYCSHYETEANTDALPALIF